MYTNNYRGISLIDTLCKVFIHIVYRRLTLRCEEYNIIDESQTGFRSGYSTTDNNFILMSLIQKYLSKNIREEDFTVYSLICQKHSIVFNIENWG